MEPIVAFFSILGAVVVGAMSPGPSFVLIARTAVARSRRDGVAAALGMGAGGVVFTVLALLGLNALLARLPWLDVGIKLAGGAYLLYLALRLWRGGGARLAAPIGATPETARRGGAFALGFTTQLSNPKTAIAYGSIFAALLPAQPPPWLYVALPPLVFAIETGWYTIVALAFSADRPRGAYLRAKGWIDRFAGAVMGALGLRLILAAARRG
jgi:threonine/homoserine/homoserine lactone efflux protein